MKKLIALLTLCATLGACAHTTNKSGVPVECLMGVGPCPDHVVVIPEEIQLPGKYSHAPVVVYTLKTNHLRYDGPTNYLNAEHQKEIGN